LLALLVCAPLGAFTYDTFAAINFAPPDLAHPASFVTRIAAFFEPSAASSPSLPRRGKSARAAPLNVHKLEAINGPSLAQSLNTGLPTVVGRTAGSHAVTNTGAATYTIPIWAPPGIRAIEPHLALTYSSAAADTLLGPGWNLSGLSAISRCARTWVQDGAPGGVALSFADKFCLDGNRLRLTAGAYGAAGSGYQTEIETFSKLTAQGVAGNGPLWFEVRGKDGLTYEYGRTGDARVFAVGSATPYLWALNKVSDRNGNNLVVSYVQTQGSFRPALIQYAFSPTYHYQVSFAYITRPTGTSLSSYIGGSQVQQQMLLSQISIQSDGALVRQYNLDYSTSPTTRRARLSAVQECTASDCLVPTTIAYQNGQAGVVSVTTSAGTGATSGRVNTLDMNGDGRMDLVYSTVSGATQTWWVRLATSSGFSAAVATGVVTTTLDRVMFDDFDANGSVDLLTTSGGSWSLSRWNGSGFSLSSTGTPVDLSTSLAVPADINGDGLPDLVYYRTDLKGVYTRLNTGTSGLVTFASTATRAYSPPQALVALWGNNSIPASAIRHMDFNGDGREDVIVLYRNGAPVQLPLVAQLFSQGSTFTRTGARRPCLSPGTTMPARTWSRAASSEYQGARIRRRSASALARRTSRPTGTVTVAPMHSVTPVARSSCIDPRGMASRLPFRQVWQQAMAVGRRSITTATASPTWHSPMRPPAMQSPSACTAAACPTSRVPSLMDLG
jgi:hypothetical protein